MVEHKLKKIGELLDHVANQNHEKLKHFDSELDKKHRLLDKKHDNLLKKHQHLDKRDTVIKQKHTHLKLKEKEYKKILGMKKGLDRKSKRLSKLDRNLKEKRQNIRELLFQEKLKVEERYREKERQLRKFMTDLELKDKDLNKQIIKLEVDRIKLLQSLGRKPRKEKLIQASAVDLWPLKMATGLQQNKSKVHKEVLQGLPSLGFGEELKKPNVKKI